jgi:hypothetical protein
MLSLTDKTKNSFTTPKSILIAVLSVVVIIITTIMIMVITMEHY